ncbi:MAG: hypothetical protein ACRD3V_09785 [Vicinamibacteria bacterium]
MTNTLHRYGAPETLENDFIVFAMAARGINDQGSVGKFQEFLRIAERHRPINLGDATKGGVFRPSKRLNPLVHWFRKSERDPRALVRNVDQPTVVSAVFDNVDSLRDFLKDVREADLGISINISALTDRADEIAREAGIIRHSVEYSLGFFGALDKLPDRATLSLATMCGHGMISFHFAKKMIDWVKEGRRTPEEASTYMARFCTCGIFNTTRSCWILKDCAHRNSG